jgi:hypothetical protein
MSNEIDREQKIKEAVNALDQAVNDMGVTSRKIGEAFLGTHPYLLNEIALGVLFACSWGKGDGRLNPRIVELGIDMWGDPRTK